MIYCITLLAYFIQASLSNASIESRAIDSLVLGLLVAFAVIFNAVIYRRESRLTLLEMGTRLRSILESIANNEEDNFMVILYNSLKIRFMLELMLKFYI